MSRISHTDSNFLTLNNVFKSVLWVTLLFICRPIYICVFYVFITRLFSMPCNDPFTCMGPSLWRTTSVTEIVVKKYKILHYFSLLLTSPFSLSI